jgi:hypothetical protein
MECSKKKACSLCLQEIKEDTKYNVFRHNTLFKLNGPDDIWNCLTKHYICEKCMKKLQHYCQTAMFVDEE